MTERPAPAVFEHSVTLRQLVFLRAVIEAGGFTAAARRLLATQPTVSYEIARLEQLTGVTLIDRRGGRVRPTAEGRLLYEYAVRAISTIEEAGDALRELRGVQRGRLAIGADGTFGTYALPRLLGEFRHQYPNVQLQGSIESSPQLLRSLRDESLELAIVCDVMGYVGGTADLVRYEIDECRFVVAAARGWPRSGWGRLPLDVLAGEPFIVREADSWPRRMFDDLAARITPPPRIALELATTEAIKQAVAAGLGLMLSSDHAIRNEVARGELVILDLEGFPIRGRYHLIHLKSRRLSFAARAFLEYLLDRVSLDRTRDTATAIA